MCLGIGVHALTPCFGAPLLHHAGELSELPSEDALVRLLNALLVADVREEGNTVTLPAGVTWPDLKSNVLYVRHFYRALWEDVLGRGIKSAALQGAAICGTPGSEYNPLCTRHMACAASGAAGVQSLIDTASLPPLISVQSPSPPLGCIRFTVPSRRVAQSSTIRAREAALCLKAARRTHCRLT